MPRLMTKYELDKSIRRAIDESYLTGKKIPQNWIDYLYNNKNSRIFVKEINGLTTGIWH